MLKFIIENKALIGKLIVDNKKDLIRHCLLNDDYNLLQKKEFFNYCTKDTIKDILKDREQTKIALEYYSLTTTIIEMVIAEYFFDDELISLLISKHISKITPSHIDRLIKKNMYLNLIQNFSNKLSDESLTYAYRKHIITIIPDTKVSTIVNSSSKSKFVIGKTIDEIHPILFSRDFTKEEVDYTVKQLLATNNLLVKEGVMKDLILTQYLSDDTMIHLLETWNPSSDKYWFKLILIRQSLDSIINCIFEKIPLTEEDRAYIIRNKKTNTESLLPLYESHLNEIISTDTFSVPVLDTHMY